MSYAFKISISDLLTPDLIIWLVPQQQSCGGTSQIIRSSRIKHDMINTLATGFYVSQWNKPPDTRPVYINDKKLCLNDLDNSDTTHQKIKHHIFSVVFKLRRAALYICLLSNVIINLFSLWTIMLVWLCLGRNGDLFLYILVYMHVYI